VTPPRPIDIRENVPLAPLTTLKVGGPARFFVRAESETQVVDALRHAKASSLDVFVLGGGSNILVSDGGFDGLVVQIGIKGIRMSSPAAVAGGSDLVYLTAQAGEDWDAFVEYCVARDLAGIECLSGIPGFLGGTPVQNVGAYGQEVSETIVGVRCIDRTSGEIVELANAECGFTYRKSIFNSTARERYIVLGVTFELVRRGEPKIVYKDLRDHFADHRPTLGETREAVLRIRRSKSMVIEAGDPNSSSAGSFFKNPIVDVSQLDTIRDLEGPVPHFPAGESKVKIPAAWLIERSGFEKGFQLGNAGISTRHSLAIVNRGNATAAEIVALKVRIQEKVGQKFGILLQPEPVFIGFDQQKLPVDHVHER
jgi:UDP-N-acetylmuramate dehydrogenase